MLKIFQFKKENKRLREELEKAKRLNQYYEGLLEHYNTELEVIRAVEENKILKDVIEIFKKQTEKGIQKYGTTVQSDNLSITEWIDHALQEHADSMVYLRCIKEKFLKDGE